ncbi:MAG: ArsB/NhaD family transporter [Candidatus Gastranaerophilales bacterium]|nr:ArsB/NhaD family transporter [Candidatus Gastranaerophilales bacterium]
MLLAGTILLVSYILIAFEKIPKVTIAMLGAAITLALGLIPPEHTFSHIDFKVIFLLISMMIIVHIAARSGLFNWLAIEILKLTKGNPIKVFASMALFTAILSAFLDNVTTVILVFPITLVIARELKIDPIPFLITEIMASNIGGAATLIGDPPNIIIGSAAGLTFMDFVKELSPVITIIFIVSTALLTFIFRKELISTSDLMQQAANIDNSKSIKNKALMIRSSIILILVILGFIFYDLIHIDAYIIALLGASILLLFETPRQILHDVEWTTIFFFIGLFIIIGGFIEAGGIKFLADFILKITKGNLQYTTMLILWASGFLSAIVDNIPYTVTMTPLIKSLNSSINIYPLWWSLSLGACLGGNATLIGAAANVIISEASDAAGHPISFMRFMKYGVLITIVSLLISSVYLYFRFLI